MNFKNLDNARGNAPHSNGSSGLPPLMRSARGQGPKWYEIPNFRRTARAIGSFFGIQPIIETDFTKSKSLLLFKKISQGRGLHISTYDDSSMGMGMYSKRFGKNDNKVNIFVPHSLITKLDSLLLADNNRIRPSRYRLLRNAFWFMSEHYFRKTRFETGPERAINEGVVYQLRRAQYYDRMEKIFRDELNGAKSKPPKFSTPTLYPANMKLVLDYLTVKAFLDDPMKISIVSRIKRELPQTFSVEEFDNLETEVTAKVIALRQSIIPSVRAWSNMLHLF